MEVFPKIHLEWILLALEWILLACLLPIHQDLRNPICVQINYYVFINPIIVTKYLIGIYRNIIDFLVADKTDSSAQWHLDLNFADAFSFHKIFFLYNNICFNPIEYCFKFLNTIYVRGRSQTMWTRFLVFLTPYPLKWT